MPATIRNTIVDLNGVPQAGVVVTVSLVPSGNSASFDDATAEEFIASSVSLTTDVNGTWQVTLKSNADFSALDTYYRVIENVSANKNNQYAIIVPSGGGVYFLRDVLASPAPTGPQQNYSLLTTQQAAAQYISAANLNLYALDASVVHLALNEQITGLKYFSTPPRMAAIQPDATHTLTLPALTDNLVSRQSFDTLINKILTGNTMANFSPDGVNSLTAPTGVTDTLALLAAVQNLSNKTFITDLIVQKLTPALALKDTTPAQTTPNKFIRSILGLLKFRNSADNADILTLDDTGILTIIADLILAGGRSAPRGVLQKTQIVANTTYNATTTEQEATGLALTQTLVAGRKYRLSLMALPFANVADDTGQMRMWDGPIGTGQQLFVANYTCHTTGQGYDCGEELIFDCVASGAVAGTSLNAGSHTFRVGQIRIAGTGSHNLTAGTGNPNQLVIEDVGQSG